ncbi:MAG: DUF4234 domain-containing protein [Vicinamibacteria bacterium]
MEVQQTDQPYAPPASISPTVQELALPRTGLLVMILITLVTLGLYIPYWFLSRRRALNHLAAEADNVNLLTFLLAATYAIAFAFGSISGALSETVGSTLAAFRQGTTIIDLVSRILTIILSFRVKSILEANHPEPLSAVGTFFLSLFYLQYKINRMGETDPVAVQFTLR